MNFKGKFEAITETTLSRFQQGGIMVGDIVKIKPKALNHPKVKEMGDNLKGNIQMLMDTDLHITVTALRSTRDSRGEMGDGLGLGSTTAPTDFWLDVAVLHSPGLKSDPITIPIEVVERQDFGASLPPTPDSLIRKGNVNIKPKEVGPYDNNKGDKYENAKSNTKLKESIEDIYSQMGTPDKKSITVRVPMEDTDETKDVLDELGVTYSVVGTNRFELHGDMDTIQAAMNTVSSQGQGGVVDVEFVGAENEPFNSASQHIPTEDGQPDTTPTPAEQSADTGIKAEEDDDKSLEEAYNGIMTGDARAKEYIIEVPNAFADNVRTYLASEGVNNATVVEGNKSYITISSLSNTDEINVALKDNVMGDLTYLKVHKSDQQLSES